MPVVLLSAMALQGARRAATRTEQNPLRENMGSLSSQRRSNPSALGGSEADLPPGRRFASR